MLNSYLSEVTVIEKREKKKMQKERRREYGDARKMGTQGEEDGNAKGEKA